MKDAMSRGHRVVRPFYIQVDGGGEQEEQEGGGAKSPLRSLRFILLTHRQRRCKMYGTHSPHCIAAQRGTATS